MQRYNCPAVDVSELQNKTLVSCVETGDEISFVCTDGSEYLMYHEQDCCESVGIEDITGLLSDLIGAPLVMAEEVSSEDTTEDEGSECDESCTWTFYKFGTIKGYVTIRWLGTSNGYYSESVSFIQTAQPTNDEGTLNQIRERFNRGLTPEDIQKELGLTSAELLEIIKIQLDRE
jgi:hypothetical protein